MAQLLPGCIVRIGPRHTAAGRDVALDDSTPWIEWTLPPGVYQAWFNVQITYLGDSVTHCESGRTIGTQTHFSLTTSRPLTDAFRGLCRVTVELGGDVNHTLADYQSPPTYFVFDPELERLVQAGGVVLSWDRPLDPDQQPISGWKYQLQIGRSAQVTEQDESSPLIELLGLVYDRSDILSTADRVHWTLSPAAFTPQPDVAYWYRVRCFDGRDWGEWSRLNAFVNRSSPPPQITLDSANPVGNEHGDVEITFTLADTAAPWYTVLLSYQGDANEIPGIPDPLYLLNPPLRLPPGTHRMIWRTLGEGNPRSWEAQDWHWEGEDLPPPAAFGTPGQIGRSRQTVTLYAQAVEKGRLGNTDSLEYTVDNTQSSEGQSGFPVTWWPVRGYMQAPPELLDCPQASWPVQGSTGRDGNQSLAHWPVVAGDFAWFHPYVLGTFEIRNSGARSLPGGYHQEYPQPIALDQPWGSSSWEAYNNRTFEQITTPRLAEGSRWGMLFLQPRDDHQSDTLPRARASRDLAKGLFLWGYRDLDDTEREYPDDYDWNTRPDWHVGRELWGQDDAWIQVAEYRFSDYEICETCQGKHYLVEAEGELFRRRACSNPYCQDGFDTTHPHVAQVGQPRTAVRAYIHPRWQRFSHWVQGQPFDLQQRYGFGVPGAPFARSRQFIYGRGLSSLDVVNDDQGQIRYYRQVLPDGTVRQLPAGSSVLWPAGDLAGPVQRQDGAPRVAGDTAGLTQTEGQIEENLPVGGQIGHSQDWTDQWPAQGSLHPGAQDFWLGGVDPDSHELHWKRRRPTQPEALAVRGAFKLPIEIRSLKMLDLQLWWDAYNTIHFDHGGGSATYANVLLRRIDTQPPGPWQDLAFDNAEFHPGVPNDLGQAGLWLLPPFVFHGYWNTQDPIQYPEGSKWQLWLQLYTQTTGGWQKESPTAFTTVQILHGVSNPANVLSCTYEPITRSVQIVYRLDDSQGDTYNLTRAYFSDDNASTWTEISSSELAGPMSGLSSQANQNIHELIWYAGQQVTHAGMGFRVRLEVAPTKALDALELPFFRWLSLPNPQLDEAESELARWQGRYITLSYDPVDQVWKKLASPRLEPGELYLLERERERILATRPEEGDTAWLETPYQGSETNGQALARINQQMNYQNQTHLPQLQQQVIQQERWIRRNLIDQGYYAEKYFLTDEAGQLHEIVAAVARSDFDGQSMYQEGQAGTPLEELKPRRVQRNWRFRVQRAAEGGEELFDEQGVFHPTCISELEQVFYVFQLDANSSFNSQAANRPLRELFYDHQGQRLSISQQYGGRDFFTPANPYESAATDSQLPADPILGSDPAAQVGGSLKLAPNLLPGQVVGDLLPASQSWNGPYRWRVAAYNAVWQENLARPRPQITRVQMLNGQILVRYRAVSHPSITSWSMRHLRAWDLPTSEPQFEGVSVSRSSLSNGRWTSPEPLDFVSDRRASVDDPTRQANGVPWLPIPPANQNSRMHPCVFYDSVRMQYRLYYTHCSFDQVQWRPMSSRAMELPTCCDYGLAFESDTAWSIQKSWVLVVNGTYHLYATRISALGMAGVLVHSTSADGETWDTLQPLSGLNSGMNPCVAYRNGTFHLWYEDRFNSRVEIVHATSADGHTFTRVGASSCYHENRDVYNPAILWHNGAWVMYLETAAGDEVVSLWSGDGQSWQGRRPELGVLTYDFGQGPERCVPACPCGYEDWHLGNLELFLLAAYRRPNGEYRLFRTRWEDRSWDDAWTHLSPHEALVPLDDPLSAVTASINGVEHTLAINAAEFGIYSDSASPRVRLHFTGWAEHAEQDPGIAPAYREYRRQSQWVDAAMALQQGYYRDPDTWNYSSDLKFYPYLR